jgi:hypothetical protein
MAGPKNTLTNTNTSTGMLRREFLKYAAGGMAGATILALHLRGNLPEIGSTTPVEVLSQLRKDSFAGHLNQIFHFSKNAFDVVELELIEVSNIKYQSHDVAGDSFSLVFKGPRSLPLEQGTYTVENKSTGIFPLFIVPVYPQGNGMYYEAVFNRLES